jgi:CO/xanthine dehydrogenase Mo-binding subunit
MKRLFVVAPKASVRDGGAAIFIVSDTPENAAMAYSARHGGASFVCIDVGLAAEKLGVSELEVRALVH